MASRCTAEAETSGLEHTLQGHVDDLRTLIQCGICIRPLYEPFTLACGHTFCYSCLTSWFAGGKAKRTCPDCRAPVKTQPAPAYLVRTMVHMFTNRAEMLDKGETTKEHLKNQTEEAARLEEDKANNHPTRGGLFGGLFRPKAAVPQPVIDVDDGVVRCPHCAWELEEGDTCAGCGYEYRGSPADSDSDISAESYYGAGESEIESEDDDQDEETGGDPWRTFVGYHPGPDDNDRTRIPITLGRLPSAQDALLALAGRGPSGLRRPNDAHLHNPEYFANGYEHGEDDYSDEEDEGENEYDEDDPFIDDDESAGPPTSSFVDHNEHDVSAEAYDLDSEPSTGTAVDDDNDEDEPPSTDGLLQWRNANSQIEEDSDESGNEEGDVQIWDDDSDEEDVQVMPSRQRQMPSAARSQNFRAPSEASWLRASGTSATDDLSSARARNRRPIIPDSDEIEESESNSSSSPPPRPARSIGRTGGSVGNAISLDDSDDDQPVGPVRRNTHRRNNRFSPY
ncbi:hypothetical protein N7541_011682 [Penicillium brevicompactum]|uniref:RING-type domain-containing protein n=1 Tax=Penicillium brevicompactum TaxID=5074 RepID=A0A9W9UIM3_PENBR|nr:hypothetical protein N7541_011682 [Penicillium brevicompactum]